MRYLIALLLAGALIGSCKKDTTLTRATAVATLNLVNAIPGSTPLTPIFNNQTSYLTYSLTPYATKATYGGCWYFALPAGRTSLSVSQQSDTLHPVYQNAGLDLAPGSAHTLFLTGSVASPESVLTTDTLPAHNTAGHSVSDSIVSIRFINLLVGSTPVKVVITGNASPEVNSLAYKSITSFRDYSALSSVSSYTFEFRDAATSALIKSFTLTGVNQKSSTVSNVIRFRNITIVLYGNAGGTGSNSPSVFSFYPGKGIL